MTYIDRICIEDFIEKEKYKIHGRLHVCTLSLKNGHHVIGTCYIGKDSARDDAIRQCWNLFGFHLACLKSGEYPKFNNLDKLLKSLSIKIIEELDSIVGNANEV